ncbi:MAG: carbohydrate ABC transporter permease [Mycobacterium leprae]
MKAKKNSRPSGFYVQGAVWYAVAILVAVLMATPYLWSVLTSLKPNSEILSLPPKWLPSRFTLEHYKTAFKMVPFGLYFANSTYLAVMGVLTNLFFGSLSGYSFAKLKFKGRESIFRVLLAAMMIPGVVTLIPTFIVLRHFPLMGGNDLFGNGGLGFINTFWAVILPGASGPFASFFMRQFFMTLPDDLMEAARIDGCPEFKVFWRIYLPLAGPALATLAIFTFQAGWNAFLWPIVVLNDPAKATVQMGLQAFSFNHTTDFGPMMAASVVAILPILVLFLLLQKCFMRGISFSGIKG